MKKILFLLSLSLALSANAQTYPNKEFITAGIQPVVVNDRQANLNIKNPYGSENVTIELQEVGDGQIKMVARDKNTGKIISSTDGVKDKHVKSSSEINGVKQDMDLKLSKNDELTGTVGYANKNTGEGMFANILGNVAGLLNQTKKGYKMSLNMKNENVGTVTYTNSKTKEIICIVNYDKYKSRIYDMNKKLIAEGITEDDNPSKIYNKVAYQKCEKVIDIFNDDTDDDDKMPDISLSDIASFFGF